MSEASRSLTGCRLQVAGVSRPWGDYRRLTPTRNRFCPPTNATYELLRRFGSTICIKHYQPTRTYTASRGAVLGEVF